MKKKLLGIFFVLFFTTFSYADEKIKAIYEGNHDAKIKLIIYESLTCGHCADFHKNVYPDLKKDFIDKGKVKSFREKLKTDFDGWINAGMYLLSREDFFKSSDKTKYFSLLALWLFRLTSKISPFLKLLVKVKVSPFRILNISLVSTVAWSKKAFKEKDNSLAVLTREASAL